MRCPRLLAAASLSIALLFARTAWSQAASPDPVQLKSEADAAFDTRNYARALEQYEAALAHGGDPRINYNVAQTLTALERYPEALAAYQRFLADAPSGTLNTAQQEKFFALLDDLKARISRIEIHCPVDGARVLVRELAVGTTPLKDVLSLNAGPAKVEVIAEGFKPYATEMTLVGGKTETIEVPLERVDFTGALAIKSSIEGTHVFVDGTDRGTAPLTLRVDRGAHVLAAKVEGYDDQSKNLTIAPGSKAEVTFFPVRSPNYTLAWAGFGAGVAGVAIGSVTGILAFKSLSDAKAQCDTTTKQCGPTGQGDLSTSKAYGALSDAFFILGGAGVGLGVYGLFSASGGRETAKPIEVVLAPGALRVRGTF